MLDINTINALSHNVNESGKVILDPYPELDQHHNLPRLPTLVCIHQQILELSSGHTDIHTHTDTHG